MQKAKRILVWMAVLGWALSGWAYAQQGEEALANQYFQEAEYERAFELYDKLLKKQPDNAFYQERMVLSKAGTGEVDAALSLVDRFLKKHPSRYEYQGLRVKVLLDARKQEEANAALLRLLERDLPSVEALGQVGNYFFTQRMFAQAKQVFLAARKREQNEQLFGDQLARIYIFEDEGALATAEYLKLYFKSPQDFPRYNAFILNLLNDRNKDAIERLLLKAVQDNSSDLQLRRLLYDFYLKTENYYEALVQARSLDKLARENGQRLITLAESLQNNRKYALSNQALDYLIENNPKSPFFLQAWFMKVKNFELKAFEQRPLDTLSLRKAVENYDDLFTQYGRNATLLDAMLSKARLCIFYLNDLPAATAELEQIERLAVPEVKKAEAKLLLGDILLIKNDIFAAEKKYKEVDERLLGAQEGAQAKYRIARLHYYQGDFNLAKSRLKVLKDNTSNDIANDAINLFLLIQDNTGLDTTEVALQRFAQAQLLIYQKRYTEALPLLDSIALAFPRHTLQSYILWEKAQVAIHYNDLDLAMNLYERLVKDYPKDVLADKTLFAMAEIHHFSKQDKETAMKLYLRLLMDYPASLYKVEARKRIRELRGDGGS